MVGVVDDDPHSRGRAVAGDTLSEREGDALVPVEKEKFLFVCVYQELGSTAGEFSLKIRRSGHRDRWECLGRLRLCGSPMSVSLPPSTPPPVLSAIDHHHL